MKKFLVVIILILTFFNSRLNAQEISNFTKGFNSGFKEGFCYNKGLGCYCSIQPLAPITKPNESADSYRDGYNRGFQVGLDLQRIDNSYKPGSTPEQIDNIYNHIPSYRPSEYIPPVDLNLLSNVLRYKQALFDSRGDWIQNKIDDLSNLVFCIFLGVNDDNYNRGNKAITDFLNNINKQPLDLTDNNIFNIIKQNYQTTERYIYSLYKSTYK